MSGQSGRIIGTIAGAALAYFTGGASYVALGATLGGAVGSLLDPKQKVEGPRLDDLKVQVSTYGIGIPKLYGTERFGGNVIWSTDKLEIPSVASQGKGGGGTESTSYKYYVHMRQLLCETPRDGSTVSIVKMFQDGELIWDASSGIPIGSALASAENLYASFVLYQGHQDQLPNPEEESWTGGPGTASAYRGVVSIYMRAIECPGGRVPQFSFVLSTSASDAPEVADMVTVPPTLNSIYMGWVGSSDGVWHYQYRSHGFGEHYYIDVSYGSSGLVTPVAVVDLPNVTHQLTYPIVGGSDPQLMFAYVGVKDAQSAIFFDVIDVKAGVRSNIYVQIGSDAPGYSRGRAAYRPGDVPTWALLSYGSGPPIIVSGGGSQTCATVTGNAGLVCFHEDGLLHIISDIAGVLYHCMRKLDGTVWLSQTVGPSLIGIDLTKSAIYSSNEGLFAYIIHHSGSSASIYKITPETSVANGSWALLCAVPGATTANISNSTSCNFWCSDEMAIYGPIASENVYKAVRFRPLTVSEVKAKDIIADQIELSGVTSYDVSTLPDSDTVYGYKLAGPASARANIEPILTAFGYYIVDEDGKIKVKRYADITSVATVTFDELGQVEDGSDSADAMPLSRTQEIDLARSVTVSYIEPTSDFQTASETEVRQVTSSTEDVQIQLAVCFASDKAKKVAQMALYDQHRRQNQRSLTVSRKFSAVSPGDGVTVECPRGTFKLWLVLSTNDTGAVCEWSVVPGDASIFTQPSVGATGYSQQQVAPLPPPSRLILLDMPILRDADNDAGEYAAVSYYGDSAWRGASVLTSDDDLNYIDKGTVTTAAVVGFAETVLSDPAGDFACIDHRSTVIVNVGNGELNTISWDQIHADGTANLAALNSSFTVDGFPDARVEVLQFRVATSLGGGRYQLSEFIRGKYGTERVSYNHGISDAFVLLNAQGMLRLTMEAGAIGSSKFYKAVSLGRSAEAVSGLVSKAAGYGLKPLSPINVKLDRTPADGSIAFAWGRRTRMSHNALRQVMPLGEGSEVYEIVIYTAFDYQVVKNVYRVYTTAFSYFPAVDGYSQLGSIPYRIYQLSDTVGRGVPFQPGQGIS